MNSAICTVTGLAPIFVITLRNPRTLASVAAGRTPTTATVEDMVEAAMAIDALVFDRGQAANVGRAKAHNATRSDAPDLRQGDKVVVMTEALLPITVRQRYKNAALRPVYEGPYEVEWARDNKVAIKLPDALAHFDYVINVRFVRPFNPRPGDKPPGPKPGTKDVYDVDTILDHRPHDKWPADELLVLWAGYPVIDATWEPAARTRRMVPSLVQQYARDLGLDR